MIIGSNNKIHINETITDLKQKRVIKKNLFEMWERLYNINEYINPKRMQNPKRRKE